MEMSDSPESAREPAVVKEFLGFMDIIRNCSGETAEEAFRAMMNVAPELREEFIFRTDGKFLEQKRALIEFNNNMVRGKLSGSKPRKALLLLPFCLQSRQCQHQIAWRIENCRRCGKCPVGPIREVCERYGIDVRLTLRSRFAPEFVKASSPDLVIAVACEHELVAGILRVAPVLCYGIINTRPEGFCKNTQVAVEEIEALARELKPA
jgi:hypothetical protein